MRPGMRPGIFDVAAVPRPAPPKIIKTFIKGDHPRQKGHNQKGGKKGKNGNKGTWNDPQWGNKKYLRYDNNDWWQTGRNNNGWARQNDDWGDNRKKTKKADTVFALAAPVA